MGLILYDINLPGMNGLKSPRAVQCLHHHQKVFMVTAYGGEANSQRAREYGCDDYFTKPTDFGVLKERLAVC